MFNDGALMSVRYDSDFGGFFSHEKGGLVRELFRTLSSTEFLEFLICEVLTKKRLRLPSLIRPNSYAVCQGSFLLNQQNYLIFLDIDGSKFIVGQRHVFVSEIYFPAENLVIKVDYSPFQEKVSDIVLDYERFSEGREENGSVFKGVFSSYTRPYHYFYDLMPALYYWDRRLGVLSNDEVGCVDFFEISNGSFLNSKNVFKSIRPHVEINETMLNERIFSEDGFLLKLGYPLSVGKEERFEIVKCFDTYLRNTALESYWGDYLDKSFADDFVLWLGVCNEKRSWLEEEEAIHLVVDYLLERYGKVVVLIDGMTKPELLEDEEFKENGHVKREVKKVEKYIKGLAVKKGVEVLSLVGKRAIDKMVFASEVDFFISNFLTDSMYPARFGHSKGIGHGSFKAKHVEHIHDHTVIIKSNKSGDAKIVNKSSNWARQSYSIPAAFVLGKVKEILG